MSAISTTTTPPTSIEREPRPGRTKKGAGLGAKLGVEIFYYRAPHADTPDYGTFAGRDEDGRWELHFEGEAEFDSQLARITTALKAVATEAREENQDARAAAGQTVWLKAIGAQGWPAAENWWDENKRGQYVDFPFRPKSVKPGDLLVMYAAGTGKVVGVERVIGDWYEGGSHERWPYRVDVELVQAVPVSQGVDLASLSSERELGKSIRQKSHIRLSEAEAASALGALGAV